MKTRWIACAVVAMAICETAQAGPFRSRSRSTSTSCTTDACGVTTTSSSTTRSVTRGSTATAQGVAEIQAAAGVMSHHGGNTAYEGVGVGSTPEAALRACCNNGRPIVDQGVALGRDGRWYACKRYSR